MALSALLLLLGLSTLAPHGAFSVVMAAAAACPAPPPGQAGYVRHFFAAPETMPFRERHGLGAIRPGDVRPLTTANDAAACERLSRAVTLRQTGPYPKTWSGYQAGSFYIVMVTTQRPPGAVPHGGGTGMIVLDAEMRIVGAVR